MEHIAIQRKDRTFTDLGKVTILCRCSIKKGVPYDKVKVGDIVYLSLGGLLKRRCIVSRALSMEYDDINDVRTLCKGTDLYNGIIYWNDVKDRCYATIVWLTENEPLPKPIHAATKAYDASWIVLDTQQKKQKWLGVIK